MKTYLLITGVLASAMLCGCDRGHTSAKDGVIQTKFPGQVTAGGQTSGQVMARSAKPETNAVYGGGSPFIAGGSGGNTGGAALGGTVTETGQGPEKGVTDPSGAMQGGNKPLGDNGGPPANAPAAGSTPVGAGTATNVDRSAPNAAGTGASVQQASPPAAPGTLTGDK